MALYFIVYIYLFCFSTIDFIVKKDRVYDCVYAGFMIFIFWVAGFRGMGNDYEGYHEIFDSLQGKAFVEIFDASEVYVEPVFAAINLIIGSVFPYQAVLVLMALVNISLIFPFFRKYSPYPYVSSLLFAGMFMYSGMMGLIRQSLAIAICMWAMAEPRNRRFGGLIFLAMTFHASAGLVVLVRFIKNKFYALKTYIIAMAIAIASNLFFFGLFKLLIAFMPAMIAWKLNIYVGTEDGMHFGFNTAVAIRLLTFVLAYVYHKQIVDTFPNYGPLFVNIYFLAIIIYVGFGFLPQMASRGAVYFHYMELLVVPMILYCANQVNRVWIFMLYALLSFWRHIDLVAVYGDAYMPYKNVLFN